MFKKLLLGSWILSAVLIAGSANAGNYWGVGFGNASFSLKNFGVLPVEDGSVFKLLWGTRNGDFGMEADFSTSEHDWEGTGGLVSHTVTNLVFSGIGYLPITKGFDLYGKAGLNLYGVSYEGLGLDSEAENGVGLALGAGLDFAASEQFHIRLEYQMLNGIDDGFDDGDINQMTVSGTYFYR